MKNTNNGSLRAGTAKVDITVESTDKRINDPLYAKVLVLDEGQTRLAIITMDVTAIGGRTISREILNDVADDFMPKLRSRIEKEYHIPGYNVMAAASHTHPFHGQLLCSDKEQIDRIVDALGQAIKNLTPVTTGIGSGVEDRISINRTLRLKNGKHWTIRMSSPCPPDEMVADVGPFDPEIGVIRIDRIDGRPLAVVYNFACHLLMVVPQGGVTADFPGFASKVIEDNLGDGAMALFLQGAGGDVCELYNKDINRPKNSEDNGTILGLSVLDAWRKIKTRKDAGLKVISQTIDLPRKNDYDQVIDELKEEQDELVSSLKYASLNFKSFLPLYLKHLIDSEYPSDYSYIYLQAEKIGNKDRLVMDKQNQKEIDKYLANIQAMERLAEIQCNIYTLEKHKKLYEKAGVTTLPSEVNAIRIADGVLVTSPAEVLTEIGLGIKKASPFKHTFISSITNGYLHYGCPADYYDKGGYEVTECALAPEWQQIYETKVAHMLDQLKS
jgi:hypothetical protein